MKNIRLLQDIPSLKDPVLIAAFSGWNDASEVATWSARFLVRKWKAVKFAEIEPEEYYVFTETRPTVKIVGPSMRSIEWPSNELYYYKNTKDGNDYVVLVGVEPQLKWQTFVEELTELIKQLKVSCVITLGSLLAAVPHSTPPRISGTATDPRFKTAENRPRPSGYQGPTGILGVINSTCNKESITTASIWGNVPHYLQAAPNLRVASAVLERLNNVLSLNLDLREPMSLATKFDRKVSELVDGNPEVAAYVKQLEEDERLGIDSDEAEMAESQDEQENILSSEDIMQDLEDFFKRGQDEEPKA